MYISWFICVIHASRGPLRGYPGVSVFEAGETALSTQNGGSSSTSDASSGFYAEHLQLLDFVSINEKPIN